MALFSVHYFFSLLSIFVACIFVAYLWLKKKYSYWEKFGVKSLNTNFFFGNYKDIILMRAYESTIIDRAYSEYSSAKFVGLYFVWKPILLIRDPELCKRIMVKDFVSFRNRLQICDDINKDHPFFAKDENWKKQRNAMLRILNTTVLNTMMPKVEEACDKVISQIEVLEESGEDVRLENIISDFTVNVAFSVIFGRKINKSTELVETINRFICPDSWTFLKAVLQTFAPNLHRHIFKTTFGNSDFKLAFKFVQELLSLDNKKSCNDLDKDEGMDDDVVAVKNLLNALLSPSVHDTICFSLLELSRNPDIQARLRKEIKEMEKNSWEYDQTFKSNTLMNHVIKETIRMYPAASYMTRVSNHDYKIDENLTIPKDMDVLIPLKAFHYDSQYFENPYVFNPDRFMDSTSWMWMPFGKGPRQCLGTKFAVNVIKTLLSAVLTRFEVLPSTRMELPIKFKIPALFGSEIPANAFWVKLRLLNERSENNQGQF